LRWCTLRREREPLLSRPDLATLKRWLRCWVAVQHRDAAERTVLTGIVGIPRKRRAVNAHKCGEPGMARANAISG
jgi:hypothetical protein